MEDIAQSLSHSKNWPPERGWPLFIAWMGGIIAMQVVGGLVMFALIPPTAAPDFGWKMLLPQTLLSVLLHAWQAWLLFRGRSIRFALWTGLPLVGIPTGSVVIAQYFSLMFPLLEAAILRGVRQRAWAWILAGMAGVVLTQLFILLMHYAGGITVLQRLLDSWLPAGSFAGGVAFATSSIYRGVWILGEAVSAVVLAWKMPPVVASTSVPAQGAA